MRNPTFRLVFEPEELAEKISFAYGFSPKFETLSARFLDQASTSSGGRYRTLDEYASLFVKRLGWSRSRALRFLAGECPAFVIVPDFEQEIIQLDGVA